MQVILVWLIFQMAKPQSLNNIEGEEESEPSSNLEDKREQDLTMLQYMRNFNQEVKLKRKKHFSGSDLDKKSSSSSQSEFLFGGTKSEMTSAD